MILVSGETTEIQQLRGALGWESFFLSAFIMATGLPNKSGWFPGAGLFRRAIKTQRRLVIAAGGRPQWAKGRLAREPYRQGCKPYPRKAGYQLTGPLRFRETRGRNRSLPLRSCWQYAGHGVPRFSLDPPGNRGNRRCSPLR